jgi:hypothetical protein
MAGNRISILATLDDKVSSGLDKIRDKLDTVGGKGTGSTAFGVLAAKGLAMVGSLAVEAGSKVVGFAEDSIKAASDLNETLQKSSVVFGSSAADVEAWGKSAAASMGLSDNAAVGAAASIGNLLLSTGTAKEKIAPMSEGIVQLAADLASFNNIPVEDALAKLQSGLVGQERPLRELGVAISAASVDTEAAALGFHKLNGTFTEGEKVQARYALIFKQTSTAQGDFARTSGGMANQQRILTAEMENTSAELGTHLIPLVIALQKDLIYAFDRGAMSFQNLSDAAAKGSINARGELTQLENAAKDNGLAVEDLYKKWAVSGGNIADVAKQMAQDVAYATNDMASHVGKSTDDMASSVYKFTRQALPDLTKIGGGMTAIGGKAVAASHQVATAMADIVSGIRGAKSDLESAASAAADAMYNPLIAKQQEYLDKKQIAETEDLIHKGKLNAKELAAAKIQLLTLQHDRIGLLTTLAEAGDAHAKKELLHIAEATVASKSASKDQKAYWQGVIDKFDALDGATAALKLDIDRLRIAAVKTKDDIANIVHGPTGAGGGGKKQRAGGGYVPGGWSGTVGEEGTEGLVMYPGGGGYVIPNSGGGSSSGGTTVHTVVNLDGRQIAAIVDYYNASGLGRAAPTLGRT